MRDPYAAEYAKRVLESIIEDNTNRYRKVRRQVASGALAVGTWYAEAHWDPSRGPFGDVVFQSTDPSRVFVCPGYTDLHDPTCPWVIVEDHLTVEQIESRGGSESWSWKNTKDLYPDSRGKFASEMEYAKAHAQPSTDDDYAEETVTVLRCYYRTSPDTYEAPGGFRDLGAGQQHMACMRCGYRDYAHEPMPDGMLPDVGMPCPQCLNESQPEPSYLVKITRERLTEQTLKYPAGRLVIVAPYQHRLLYDGPWQAPTRSFPLFQYRAYEIPYEQRGGTDTLIYWSLQALMDALRRQAYEQMVTSKPVIVVAGGVDNQGLLDGSGQPFIFDDTNGQIAYYNGPTTMGMIQHVQGNGMPASLPQLYQILSGSFYQTQGIGDIQFSPDRSRDVAFASLKLQQETGDIAVDDHREVFREEEGIFLGCVLDIWVANSTAARAVRYLGEDGQVAWQLLKGSDIPNVDVVVGSPPSVKQGASDEVQTLVNYSQLPYASLRKIAAKRIGLPPSEVADIEAEIQQMQQMQRGQPAAQAPAGTGALIPPEGA